MLTLSSGFFYALHEDDVIALLRFQKKEHFALKISFNLDGT